MNLYKLDCLADAARTHKDVFPSGIWKLYYIYSGLTEIKGHATEQDWTDRLALLQPWIATKPTSVTAHVALMGAYITFAWDARGNGSSDTVNGNGWRLFNQRLEKTQSILDENSELTEKCPESYLLKQQIAPGEEGLEQESVLLKRAIRFEPSYYNYYPAHATILLPKWYGEPGDAANFAAESADRVGGQEAEILYFQIATEIVCRCGEPEFTKLSWQRIRKGWPPRK